MELSDYVAQALHSSLLMRYRKLVIWSSIQGFPLMQLDSLEHNVTATVLDTCSAQGSFLSNTATLLSIDVWVIHTVAMNIFLQWCLNGIGSWGYVVY